MELKYIWINEFNIIENLGFNFNHSDKHRFNYNLKILELLPNERLPLDFGPNITGVTAIAGENGSGKSSLCEAVLSSTATYTNGGFGFDRPFKGIVCYGNHIFIYKELTVKNIGNLEKNGYKVIFFNDSPFEDMKAEWRKTFMKGGFIYYSNILDYRSALNELNLANISTFEALKSSYLYSTSYQKQPLFNQENENRDKDKHNSLQIHYNVEGNRIVKLYLNHFELVSFIKVRYFLIKNTYSGNNRWLDLDKISIKNANLDYNWLRSIKQIPITILNMIFDNTQQPINIDKKIKIEPVLFKKAIKHLYRYNLIAAISILNGQLPEHKIIYDFVYSSHIEDDHRFKQEISKLLRLYDLIIDHSKGLDGDEFDPNFLKSYLEETEDWRFYLIENWYLENNEKNRALLLDFIALETRLLQGDSPFRRITNLNITPLSSGEHSMLTFFSRIQDVVDRYTTGIDEKERLILFIDEGEVGFHPAWKRVYFKMLLDFLNKCKYKFQIILTTHSPYLLSDLPAENILLIQRGENGKTKLLDSNEFKTFGSNIHELLATSFFLHNGFMGEFAKQKIEELVLFFKGENENYTKESAKKLISLIGDEIIALRLTDMYNERFNEPIQTDEAEYLMWLSAEIERVQLKVKK